LERHSYLKLAGALLFAGVAQFIPAMSVAEAVYPNYSVSAQPISDLGATCVNVGVGPSVSNTASVCTIIEPSAVIFDASVFLLGLLSLMGALAILRSGNRALGVSLALGGVGAMGVGVFPETTGSLHVLVSFIAFFFAGVSALISYRATRPPMSYLSVALGATSLISLVLYASSIYLGLGEGGMERLIAYPALIWIAGFGAHLMGSHERNDRFTKA
jgi:hypothetical membrane protein